MIPESLYSVSRDQYKVFVEEIKPEYRRIETIELNKWATATKIFSHKTGKCLCSRVTYDNFNDDEERRPEAYYIFEMPDDDERQTYVPKMRLELNTREEVQAFVNLVSKLQKDEAANG